MRFALVNPNWNFDGSIYFGCRQPHLPLEYGYSKILLERAGHEALLIDGQMGRLPDAEIRDLLAGFRPDITVITTAPSYLFWRCPPPELSVPMRLVRAIRPFVNTIAAVGPHGSTTPRAVLEKLDVDVVVMGECEELLPRLAGTWKDISGICYRDGGHIEIQGEPHASNMSTLPALEWADAVIEAHEHHHHRFDEPFHGMAAEMEASRGCPYHCTFCAKDNFRNQYRRRSINIIVTEMDRLLAQGVTYIYFIDEIFLPNRELLEALISRARSAHLNIGVQTRIDLWSDESIDLLAEAGCISIEAGVESLTKEGRARLDKKCRLDTAELSERLIYAKRRIPFVQGNLIRTEADDSATIQSWRKRMREAGVWANDPVPLFPYPGSPDYTRRWGKPDDLAWERAHQYYLSSQSQFSEIQDARPRALAELEQM